MPSKLKSPFFRLSLALVVFIGGLLLFYLADQFQMYKRLRRYTDGPETTFKSYPGFGIQLPAYYEIHGIDVSRYQRRINWSLARQMKVNEVSLRFAFIKATEGGDMVDEQFYRNWRRSKQAGFIRGAYHFYRQQTDPYLQALHFTREVNLQKGDLPPVLDVEKFDGADPAQFIAGIRLWLETVEQHYGVKPIIYTNAHFYNTWLATDFSEFPLWVAHYQQEKAPMVTRDWQFWQHNEGGRVNGINSYVDFNVFSGTESEFQELLIK
jgi:lysozyme